MKGPTSDNRVLGTHDTGAAHGHGHAHGASHVPAATGHVVGWPILAATCIALFVLTAITYYTAVYINLGEFNIWLAMLIATIKASLVCMFFMHLRWDRPFNVVVLLASIVFMVLFLSFAVMDKQTYDPDVEWQKAAFYSTRP